MFGYRFPPTEFMSLLIYRWWPIRFIPPTSLINVFVSWKNSCKHRTYIHKYKNGTPSSSFTWLDRSVLGWAAFLLYRVSVVVVQARDPHSIIVAAATFLLARPFHCVCNERKEQNSAQRQLFIGRMLITNAGTFEGTFNMHPQRKNTKKVYYVLERETEIKRPRIDLQIIFCCSAVTFIVPIILEEELKVVLWG